MKRLLALIPAVLLLASCNGDLNSDYDTLIILPGNALKYDCNSVPDVNITSASGSCNGTIYFCWVRNKSGYNTIIGHTIAAKCENGNMLYNLSDVGFKPLSKQHE